MVRLFLKYRFFITLKNKPPFSLRTYWLSAASKAGLSARTAHPKEVGLMLKAALS